MWCDMTHGLVDNQDDSDPAQPDLSEVQDLLPAEILHLSHAFPFGSSSPDVQILSAILSHLPPLPTAWTMIDVYYSHSSWMSVGLYFYGHEFNLIILVFAGMSLVLGSSLRRKRLRMCMSMLMIQKRFRHIVLHLSLLSCHMEPSWILIGSLTHRMPSNFISLLEHR